MSQKTNRTALLGKKLGMSQVWDENGFFVPVTLVDVSINVVTAVKTEESDGYNAEERAAASIRTKEGLSWDEYVPRLQRYYETVEFLFSPDLLVVGGGVSKKADKFLPKLKLRTPIVPAELQNRAGIIGAAVLAVDEGGH